jgi:uncharacterized protein (UPF0332 family)
MIDEKKLKEASNRVKQYLMEGIITTKGDGENVTFFLKNAEESLDAAKALLMLTDEAHYKKLGFTSFNGLLWTVNASYYSMFYTARAMLEKEGVKIGTDRSVHAVTFDALIHFCYLNSKLQKGLLADYLEAQEAAAELLGKDEADKLVEAYFFEKRKRARFTYEMGETLVKKKAETSLERAQRFHNALLRIIRPGRL